MGQVNIIVFGDAAYQGRGMNALIVLVAILRKVNDGLFLSGGCWARFLIATRAFAGAGAAAAPSASITPTTVFTWTVAPSATLISFNTPAAGAGISASTLSVEISNSGSSRRILSPGFFNHLVIVPSKMDSPICGMTMSVGIIPFRGCSD